MKIHITLLLLFVSLLNGMEVETEQPSAWYTLPEEIQLQIAAYSDLITKESLHYVNKQLSKIVCKNNIIAMLNHLPCPLHQQDHLDAMVHCAKESNVDAMRKLIKNAPYCNHSDWLDVLPYFISDDAPEIELIKLLQENTSGHQANVLEELLLCIMNVYKGDNKVLNEYKIKHEYQKISYAPSYGSGSHILLRYRLIQYYFFNPEAVQHCSDIGGSIEEAKQAAQEMLNDISPLHITVAKQHPIAIAKLLLSQNKELLNVVDHDWGCTAIMMRPTTQMCTFLLSRKNIYIGEPGLVYDLYEKKEIHHKGSLLNRACRHAPLEIITAIFEHLEQNKRIDNTPYYDLCLNAIINTRNWLPRYKGLTPNVFPYVLNKVQTNLTNEEILQLFSDTLLHETLDIADILMKKHPALIDINTTKLKLGLRLHDDGGYDPTKFSGVTPLFAAAKMNHIELVQWLLERGANPDIPDNNGKKPIDVAYSDKIKQLLTSD